MPPAILTSPKELSTPSSLPGRLLNLLVCPGAVFEEVVQSPTRVANWVVPTLLAGLASLILLVVGTSKNHTATAISQMVEVGQLSASQTETVSNSWNKIGVLATGLSAVGGMFWAALLLWLIGRVFLKTVFPFWKSVEVAGLTSMVLALGTVVTTLIMIASGDASARPALSFFVRHLPPDNHARVLLDAFNFFHLWTTSVLAIGLARLAGVSVKESAFWVFGYWLLARVALILLN